MSQRPLVGCDASVEFGVSEAINDLARAGLTQKRARKPFKQRAARLSLTIDVGNLAEALEQLDGPARR